MNLEEYSFDKSKSDQPRLEISVKGGCGRLCAYCPQELYITQFKKIAKGKMLTYDDIVLYSKNIPNETLISWTGYTEPLDCKDFTEIVEHFHQRGLPQLISTTLCGTKKSTAYFVENVDKFSAGISLHVPDNEGLMRGRFDESYAAQLQKVLINIRANPEIKCDIFLIGDEVHRSIASTVAEACSFQNVEFVSAKYLNTRNSSVDAGKFGLLSSVSQRSSNERFMCSYKRLNRGVLLPNGDVTLCCQDYGLERILGNLKAMSLEDIYKVIENHVQWSEDFKAGRFYPCVKCEHYTTIDNNHTTGRQA